MALEVSAILTVVMPAFLALATIAGLAEGDLSAKQAPQVAFYRTDFGWIVTDDRRKAEWAAARLAETAAIYARHFRGGYGRGVIVEAAYAGSLDRLPASERAWTLRWPTSSFPQHRASRASIDDHHLEPGSALRHELGHLFFMRAEVPNKRRLQYGGDAPDWLDEAAAVLMETQEVQGARRVHFRKQVCSGRLVPLSVFLRRQHPVFAAPRMQRIIAAARARGSGRATTVAIPVAELGITKDAAADFYAQAGAVADFLIERIGRRNALSVVAGDVRRHGTPEFWTRSGPWTLDRGGGVSLDRAFLRWSRVRTDLDGGCREGHVA